MLDGMPVAYAVSYMFGICPPSKILLVDDHPAVLRQTISLLPEDYEVVETLESGFGLKAAVSRHEPDLIVLDITLPGVSGIELASRLRQSGYSTKDSFLRARSWKGGMSANSEDAFPGVTRWERDMNAASTFDGRKPLAHFEFVGLKRVEVA